MRQGAGLFERRLLGHRSVGERFDLYLLRDSAVVSGRIASLLGYVGGQSFPFTAGSGYTNGTTNPTVTCSTLASGGAAPKFDVTVSGGAIVNVSPANATGATGLGVGSTCTVALPAGGSGGAIPTISLAPVEGMGGMGLTTPTTIPWARSFMTIPASLETRSIRSSPMAWAAISSRACRCGRSAASRARM